MGIELKTKSGKRIIVEGFGEEDFIIHRYNENETYPNPTGEDTPATPLDSAKLFALALAYKNGTLTPDMVLAALPEIEGMSQQTPGIIQKTAALLGYTLPIEQIIHSLPTVQTVLKMPQDMIRSLVAGLLAKNKPAILPKAELVQPAPGPVEVLDAVPLDQLDFAALPERNGRYLKEIGGLATLQKARIGIEWVSMLADGEIRCDDKDKGGKRCFYFHLFDAQKKGIGCHPASHGANRDLLEVAPRTKYVLPYLLEKENGGAGDMYCRGLVTEV